MNYDLYVITDSPLAGGRSHDEIVKLTIEGGADVIQLRDKACSSTELVEIGNRIRKIARKTGTTFIVNDHLNVALACDADGVHLGQGDLSVRRARKIVPKDFIIGVSVGSVSEALKAFNDGADYIAASPVFPTEQKKEAITFCGLEGVRQIRVAVDIPLVAIGGIGLHNIRDVLMTGVDGVAVISAVMAQPDITSATRELKQRIREIKIERLAQLR